MLGHLNLKADDELDMLIRGTKNATRIMARKLLGKKILVKPTPMEENMEKYPRRRC
jgi:hypothetical protein